MHRNTILGYQRQAHGGVAQRVIRLGLVSSCNTPFLLEDGLVSQEYPRHGLCRGPLSTRSHPSRTSKAVVIISNGVLLKVK